MFGVNKDWVIYTVHLNGIEKVINFDLLLFDGGETTNFISKLPKLVGCQRTKHCSKLIICKRCFTVFSNKGRFGRFKTAWRNLSLTYAGETCKVWGEIKKVCVREIDNERRRDKERVCVEVRERERRREKESKREIDRERGKERERERECE